MSKYLRILSYPLGAGFPSLLLLLVLLGAPSILLSLLQGALRYTVYLAMLYYLLSYIVVLILNVLCPKNWMKVVILTPLFFWCAASLFCVFKFQSFVSADFWEIILGTNAEETAEFFSTFVSWQILLSFVLGSIAFASVLFYIFRTEQMAWLKSTALRRLSFLVLIVSLLGCCHNNAMVRVEIAMITDWAIFRFEESVDLRNHRSHPRLSEVETTHPDNVVLIIGESFSKNHSSLYGYERRTNPCLDSLYNEESLVLFTQVTAPAATTTKAFKYLMTDLTLNDPQEVKWYDKVNIIDCFMALGYRTNWFSTQAEKGFVDNLSSSFSKICDNVLFVGRYAHDDLLLDCHDSLTAERNFVVYHLMGQHEGFSERYPDEFCVFSSNQEKDSKERIIAEYDNATLFNDYVVSSIIHQYEDSNSLVVYLSDHGLDIFDTDADFFGHAMATEASQRHCKDIPFMVYVSPKCSEQSPWLKPRLLELREKEMCTDNLIHELLGFVGYSIMPI